MDKDGEIGHYLGMSRHRHSEPGHMDTSGLGIFIIVFLIAVGAILFAFAMLTRPVG